MVAKSYQKFEIVTDVYESNGRKYVKIRDDQGSIKQVRWYTDAEYRKMYKEAPAEEEFKRIRSKKDVLGFKEGYITIFKGDTYAVKDELSAAGARYTRFWGWGIPGGEPVPELEGIEPIRLDWDVVATGENDLRSESVIREAVDELLYEPSNSEFVGMIGERLRGMHMTVVATVALDGFYGESTLHEFTDDDGNCYTWITSAKHLPEGHVYWVDGTVKDHQTYRNVKKTVLTRCRVSEDTSIDI